MHTRAQKAGSIELHGCRQGTRLPSCILVLRKLGGLSCMLAGMYKSYLLIMHAGAQKIGGLELYACRKGVDQI